MARFYYLTFFLLTLVVSCKKADELIEVQGYIANSSDTTLYTNTGFIFYNYYRNGSLLFPSTRDNEENIIPFTTDDKGYFHAIVPIIRGSELQIRWPGANSYSGRSLYDFNMSGIRDNKVNLGTIYVE
jgi:hypothetical protein